VRRFVSILLLLAFAASLNASVPSRTSGTKFNQGPTSLNLDESRAQQKLALTAAPADAVSFYLEFYSTETLPSKAQKKSGLLHWFTSTVKRTAQKVAFFSN
jgi:hypothetical protein